MTRTFISAAHFHLLDAISYNPVGLVFFGIVVFQIPFRLAQIHRISRGRPPLNLGRFEQWLLLSLCLAMTVQWLVRLAIHAFG